MDDGDIKDLTIENMAKQRNEKPSEVVDDIITLKGPRKRIRHFLII